VNALTSDGYGRTTSYLYTFNTLSAYSYLSDDVVEVHYTYTAKL